MEINDKEYQEYLKLKAEKEKIENRKRLIQELKSVVRIIEREETSMGDGVYDALYWECLCCKGRDGMLSSGIDRISHHESCGLKIKISEIIKKYEQYKDEMRNAFLFKKELK